MSQKHNLDINMYSLQELLGLFDLDYDISIEDLKRAKKKVLMTHPDKSKLDAKYFLFYKKAFDMVVQFYNNQNKHQQTSDNINNASYDPQQHNQLNDSSTKKVSSVLNNMKVSDFQNKFNKLFDENMKNKPDPRKNEWFTSEKNEYEVNETVNSKNMGDVFNRIKDNQNSMIKYRGVETLCVNSNSGNRFYDDEDNDEYVTTDPFSKLKFDDLRKVHKDQTVLTVSERDINKVQQYSSVDHFMRERGKQSLTPLEKQQAEQLLAQQDKTYRQRMMQKEYDAKKQTMKYEEKNKGILSNFLRITN
jgi:hypothetical protein